LKRQFEPFFEQSEEAPDLLRLPIGVHSGFLDHFIEFGTGESAGSELTFRYHWLFMPEFQLKINLGPNGLRCA